MATKTVVFRADRLYSARQAARMNQEAVAVAVGVTRTQISNLERGTSPPSIETLVRLATLLNVSTDWLLNISSVMQVAEPPPDAQRMAALEARLQQIAQLVNGTP